MWLIVEAFETGTPWWWSWSPAVAPYAVLMRLFVDGRISADEFEVLFLPLYKGDSTRWSAEIYGILNGFFYAVDDYNRDPDLRGNEVDANELRRKAALVLQDLAKLAA